MGVSSLRLERGIDWTRWDQTHDIVIGVGAGELNQHTRFVPECSKAVGCERGDFEGVVGLEDVEISGAKLHYPPMLDASVWVYLDDRLVVEGHERFMFDGVVVEAAPVVGIEPHDLPAVSMRWIVDENFFGSPNFPHDGVRGWVSGVVGVRGEGGDGGCV
jgi:hypothetical protein